jgi:hypothetical protein
MGTTVSMKTVFGALTTKTPQALGAMEWLAMSTLNAPHQPASIVFALHATITQLEAFVMVCIAAWLSMTLMMTSCVRQGLVSVELVLAAVLTQHHCVMVTHVQYHPIVPLTLALTQPALNAQTMTLVSSVGVLNASMTSIALQTLVSAILAPPAQTLLAPTAMACNATLIQIAYLARASVEYVEHALQFKETIVQALHVEVTQTAPLRLASMGVVHRVQGIRREAIAMGIHVRLIQSVLRIHAATTIARNAPLSMGLIAMDRVVTVTMTVLQRLAITGSVVRATGMLGSTVMGIPAITILTANQGLAYMTPVSLAHRHSAVSVMDTSARKTPTVHLKPASTQYASHAVRHQGISAMGIPACTTKTVHPGHALITNVSNAQRKRDFIAMEGLAPETQTVFPRHA